MNEKLCERLVEWGDIVFEGLRDAIKEGKTNENEFERWKELWNEWKDVVFKLCGVNVPFGPQER